MAVIAKVAVQAAPYAIDKVYDYLLPRDVGGQVGCRVLVPFGRGNRLSEAVILATGEGVPDKPLKTVRTLLDAEPVMSEKEIRLALWMRQRYFCTFYDALHTILPAAVWYRYREMWRLARDVLPETLPEKEAAVCRLLLDGPMETEALKQALGDDTALLLRRMEKAGTLCRETESRRKVRDKVDVFAKLAVPVEQALELVGKTARRQREVVAFLAQNGETGMHDLCYFTGASRKTVELLALNGTVSLREQEAYRITEKLYAVKAEAITLNDEQQQVYADILQQALSGKAGVTLLQGVTGSGKTLVAAAAIWFAAQNGWQSAMLAPTEILARQHAANLADRLEPFGVNVTLLVGGMKAAEKRVALAAIADGRAGLVVGTHAVLTDSVVFKNLGLAIVDEQHRFGVRQRGILAGKANNPHLLVMSATPIPRTLGLLMYGDLDISILDELPPGRKPIKTWFITGKKRRDMYGFLEKQIAAGHQVYIVCPAIEENEMDSGMKAVKQYYEQVACPLLPGRRIGLLHGKMKPKDKDEVMQQFKAGELDVLVSTTVIEVGVDVPNATVMVIENAERFGLSALHQLRGRVGRGAANSCCILISDNEGEAVRQRLHFLCRTSDGFAVAKYDLETRGPGDFFGEAQHGLPALHVADLVQDTRTLTVAQQEAKALLALDPNLAKPEHKALSDEVERLFATAGAMN